MLLTFNTRKRANSVLSRSHPKRLLVGCIGPLPRLPWGIWLSDACSAMDRQGHMFVYCMPCRRSFGDKISADTRTACAINSPNTGRVNAVVWAFIYDASSIGPCQLLKNAFVGAAATCSRSVSLLYTCMYVCMRMPRDRCLNGARYCSLFLEGLRLERT